MDSGRGFMEEIPKDIYEKAVQKFDTPPLRAFPENTKPKKHQIFQKQSGVFQIGEELEIKGAWFRVKKINPFGIMLKSIPSKPTDKE